ncbi:phage major capsid protein [Defluviimonas sp. SAOS-178_SWC]|uniref:phage major capsid protein n=1 Tax=Defluviimonas sp. SAOS-178_SWC TaxID=3121287 RepID=UPI003221A39F
MTKQMNPLRGIVAVRADATGDIKALIEKVNGDFSTFKETIEAKNKEVLAKFDDVVTTEKLEKLNASLSETQAEIDKINVKITAAAMGAGQDDRVKDKEYTAAFRAHVRKGDVQASLNKGADSEGGYLAPVEWDRTITDKLVEVSPMRQIAKVQVTSQQAFVKLFNLRGAASGWVSETAARTQTNTPTFGAMTIRPGELYANPAATQGMLDDSEIDLEAWLAGEVETEFAYQEGLTFVSGTGVNRPNGFLTYVTGAANAAANPLGAIQIVPAAAVADIAATEVYDLVYALPESFSMGARFVANRTTIGELRKLVDLNGQFMWQPSMQEGQPAQLAGHPVTEMPGMPNIGTGAIPLAFGDFERGYLIVDRTGVRVLRDPFTNKPYVHFYTTKRVGGAVVNPEAIKVLKNA